jgi:cytochrome-b5 reductase
MDHKVTLLMSEFVTHDVKRFVVERPATFRWAPGQSVDLAVDQEPWQDKSRPFTPTSLADDKVLEFTIKAYPEHHGVTEKLHSLRPGERLSISDPWGALTYHGPGVFIAGGAGITPFIAILRRLADEGRMAGHRLIYSNKTPDDIINELEFRSYFGGNATFLCTRAAGEGCPQTRITKAFLQDSIHDFSQHFYTCGPRAFVKEINQALVELGASPETLVFEK